MTLKLFISSVILALIPSAVAASPSGHWEAMRCVYNGTMAQRCQVKSEYEGRMEFLVTTIQWEDGPVTRLKKPTGNSGGVWTDAYGGKWKYGPNTTLSEDGLGNIYTNIQNGNQILLRHYLR